MNEVIITLLDGGYLYFKTEAMMLRQYAMNFITQWNPQE